MHPMIHFTHIHRASPHQAASQPNTARGELIAACFRGLNVSGSGHLSAAEMKRFAQHTGAMAMAGVWGIWEYHDGDKKWQ